MAMAVAPQSGVVPIGEVVNPALANLPREMRLKRSLGHRAWC